jgi:hypothetical protein
VKSLVLICFCVLSAANLAAGQAQTAPDWHSYDFPFRVLNITSNGQLLWVCGTKVLRYHPTNGANCQVKHQTKDGGLLLNIDFADSKFGYATGSGGLILTTTDGGETWIPHPGTSETILQASFADLQHGLVRTPASLLFTVDVCMVCETRGCFSSNGVISGIFSEKSDFSVFPANKALTTKWASTDSTVCFVGNHVECATLKKMPQAPNSDGFPVRPW